MSQHDLAYFQDSEENYLALWLKQVEARLQAEELPHQAMKQPMAGLKEVALESVNAEQTQVWKIWNVKLLCNQWSEATIKAKSRKFQTSYVTLHLFYSDVKFSNKYDVTL